MSDDCLLNLLDREVYAFIGGIKNHSVLGKIVDGTISVDGYVFCLQRLYALDSAVNRFPKVAEKRLAQSPLKTILKKRFHASAIEEENHEHYIQRDLRQLGAIAREDPDCYRMLNQILADNPERWLGIGYLLETTAARLFPEMYENLTKNNIIPENALTWLKLHATVDQEHAKYWRDTVNEAEEYLTSAEKESIAAAAGRIATFALSRYG